MRIVTQVGQWVVFGGVFCVYGSIKFLYVRKYVTV